MALFKWSDQTVLLTGSTGFLGRELLLRLYRAGVPRIFLLIRGEAEARATKLNHALDTLYLDPAERQGIIDRCAVLNGDITEHRFGLSEEDHATVLAEVTHVIHCAANVNFSSSFSQHFVINLGGTRHALNLAEELRATGRLRKFDYVGTAYVAGDRVGFIRESDLDAGQGFHNGYEESKFQAELEVRSRQDRLPITRFRPSVVMGDQSTGRTSNFMMMYWLVKIYRDGWWRTIPAMPGTVVDIIPVNFVVDAIMAISPREDSLGKAFHLAAGPENATSVDELCKLVQAFFNGKPIRMVPYDFYVNYVRPVVVAFAPKKLKKILTAARVYEPYFKMRKVFDTANTTEALRGTGLAPTPVPAYFTQLFEYAVATDWGKHPLGGDKKD